MTHTNADTSEEITMEVPIAASPETVWKALTDDAGEWWPAEFYIGGEAGKRSYHIEAWPGGRVYEQWEGGGGLLWGQVWHAVPGKLLQVSGNAFPEWGGPAITFITWMLAATDSGCTLHFTEHTLGKTTPNNVAEKVKGWTFLLDGVLKAYIEGTTPPAWEG